MQLERRSRCEKEKLDILELNKRAGKELMENINQYFAKDKRWKKGGWTTRLLENGTVICYPALTMEGSLATYPEPASEDEQTAYYYHNADVYDIAVEGRCRYGFFSEDQACRSVDLEIYLTVIKLAEDGATWFKKEDEWRVYQYFHGMFSELRTKKDALKLGFVNLRGRLTKRGRRVLERNFNYHSMANLQRKELLAMKLIATELELKDIKGKVSEI